MKHKQLVKKPPAYRIPRKCIQNQVFITKGKKKESLLFNLHSQSIKKDLKIFTDKTPKKVEAKKSCINHWNSKSDQPSEQKTPKSQTRKKKEVISWNKLKPKFQKLTG